MQFAGAFGPLRDHPADQVHLAAAELLAGSSRWSDVVREALQMPERDFVDSVLPEYVPDVEPKVFLIHEVRGVLQVVLGHFDARTFGDLLAQRRIGPHFHHFSFSTRILHGQYVQWRFRNDGSVREPKLGFERQVACPVHTVYSLRHERYHCVFSPEDDTMSLMIRGPAQFKPRLPCERTAAVVRDILTRRERMLSTLPRLIDGVGRLVDVDRPTRVS
jgi:hypothetical protein